MLRTLAARSPARRRGAVLIVVLAMLVLFAVLGLSFVLYSEAQAAAANSNKIAENKETEPNAAAAAERFMGPFIYGVSDTGEDLSNPLRGQDLARSKYSYQAGVANWFPFTGVPPVPTDTRFPDPVALGAINFADSRQIVRFTWDTTNSGVFDPERIYGGVAPRNSTSGALVGTYFPKNYPYTYPDRHDFFLAQMDPSTGRITVPSFHRPDLGNWIPGDPNNFENQANGKFKTLRPRQADHTTSFPLVPMNPNGTYTGDVSNMKFVTGSQLNDSYWMDAGGPVLRWRGKQYKAMVAPLVLDLSARVNLSVAGNLKNQPNDATNPSGSNQGWGPWEVNPMRLDATLTNTDLQNLIQRRQGNNPNPPADRYTVQTVTTRMNRQRMPGQASLIDTDGSGPAAGNGLMLPALNTSFQPFPTYPARFAANTADLTTELTNHPSQFNPLLYPRTPGGAANQPGGFGHDDLIKLLPRYSDGKNRQTGLTSLPSTGLTPATDTANARYLRALTTTYSTTQQFATIDIRTSATTTVRLGPVDLNRELTEYRQTSTYAPSATNRFPPTTVAPFPPSANTVFDAAARDRQHLARDIFLRLIALPQSNAVASIVDGTLVRYNAATGYLTIDPTTPGTTLIALAQWAQLAANMVDYVDADDVMTVFVWNPDPTNLPTNTTPNTLYNPTADQLNLTATALPQRTVFGTEQPRLVINEAYVAVKNTTGDAGITATQPYIREHWVELHNPIPLEPATGQTLSDNGGARLMYKQNVTQQVTNLITGATGNYLGATYTPYRLEVAEVDSASADQTPYTTYLDPTTSPPGRAALDTAAIPGMTVKVRMTDYTNDPTAASTLTQEDERYVVRPIANNVASGPDGGNTGYAVIGPTQDRLPNTTVTHTISPPDATAPPAPTVSSMAYPTNMGAPNATVTTAATANTSVVILRRLANPYLPAQDDPTQIGTLGYFNPYVTVDYVERVPTADRIERDHTGAHTGTTRDRATLGRDHPYSALGFIDETGGTTDPRHTLFQRNSNLLMANNRSAGTNGLVWFPHLDREAANVLEVLHAQEQSPARLTHTLTSANMSRTVPYQWYRNSQRPTRLLDLLTTHTRLAGTPLGGREPGRLNLNTLNDPLLLSALFDPQAGNNFTGVYDPTTLWNNYLSIASGVERTRNGRTPGITTAEDATTGSDRPFRHSLYFPTGTNPTTDITDDSTFRVVAGTPTTPVFLNNVEETADRSAYTQLEPLRKIWNNVSHTSDSFLVLVTVGFFEVTNTGPWSVTNQPQFGAELFDKVPGDLRAQFAGIIDRSNLAVANPTTPTVAATEAPFQTKLTTDASPGATTINVEATFVAIGNPLPDGTTATADTAILFGDGLRSYLAISGASNTALQIGYGDSTAATNPGDGEWRLVTGVAQRQRATASGNVVVPGEVTLTVPALNQFHGGGTLVSNVVFGSPGPQPGVTLPQLKQRGIVPYFTRIEP
jgi:hypothetical protein